MNSRLLTCAVIAVAAVSLTACGSDGPETPPITNANGFTTGPPATASTTEYFGKQASAVAKDAGCTEYAQAPQQDTSKEKLGLDWFDAGTCVFDAGSGSGLKPTTVTIYTYESPEQQAKFVNDLDATGGFPGAIGAGAYIVVPPAFDAVIPFVAKALGFSTRLKDPKTATPGN